MLGRAKSCRWQVFVRRRPQKGCRWGRRKDLIGMHKFVVCVRCFEVCKTSKLPEKGFNCCGAKLRLRCADSRFAEPRSFPVRETSCHFLRRAKSNQKARGAKPCDPRFKALPKVSLQKFPAASAETGFAHKAPAKRL